MATADEIQQLLSLGHESRSFEVKGPGSLTDRGFCAKVARAAIAMGNLRDGGLIVLGIDETQMTAMLPGLSATELAEWSDFDNVNDALSRYIDPPAGLRLFPLTLSSQAEVVVIEVFEFEDVPHLCKREYPGTLAKGMAYVRPRGKPESVPVPSPTEMRELLDLAITKGVRDFIRRAGAVGIQMTNVVTPDDLDRVAFDQEEATAWSAASPAVEKILALGHSNVSIRPGPFVADRLTAADLEPMIFEDTVRLRGWPLPYVSPRLPVDRYGGWIGQDIEPEIVPHFEAWRACVSGQFLQRRVFVTDLRPTGELLPDAPGATGAVAVWDVLLYLVEVAELGARLATRLECETITFIVSLEGIAGRQLISGDWRRELGGPYLVRADRLSTTRTFTTAGLLENPREVGVALTQLLLKQFGLNVPDAVLRDWQEQVFGGR